MFEKLEYLDIKFLPKFEDVMIVKGKNQKGDRGGGPKGSEGGGGGSGEAGGRSGQGGRGGGQGVQGSGRGAREGGG